MMSELANARRASLNGLRPASELAAARPHGDRLRYIAGCRCQECRRANTQYETERAKARKAGDWNGLVDAAPVRAHLAALSAAGVGRRQVGDISGVCDTVLSTIIAGARAHVRARTARAIQAITKDALADGALIDAAPTWVLLDDLLATGYTKAELARELGYSTPALQIKRGQCTVRTAYEVQLVHARLRRVPHAQFQKPMQLLREEGYRESQIRAMSEALAARLHLARPDFKVTRGFISAHAVNVLRKLLAEVTEEGS